MAKMTEQERLRLLDIRLASKRGHAVNNESHAFCQAMYKKDPQGYIALDKEIQRIVAEEFRF